MNKAIAANLHYPEGCRRIEIMSTLQKKRYTPQEYLAIDRKAERKSQYFDDEIFMMAGASMESHAHRS